MAVAQQCLDPLHRFEGGNVWYFSPFVYGALLVPRAKNAHARARTHVSGPNPDTVESILNSPQRRSHQFGRYERAAISTSTWYHSITCLQQYAHQVCNYFPGPRISGGICVGLCPSPWCRHLDFRSIATFGEDSAPPVHEHRRYSLGLPSGRFIIW